MKASLRLTLQIIAVILFLLLVIPVFLPPEVTITSSVAINAPVKTVFAEVNTLRRWKTWSPFEADSTMIDHYSGPAEGVGAKRTWTSARLGNGQMMITKSIPNQRIETKLKFGAPGTASGRWTFTHSNNTTTVEWQLQIQELHYPFGRWLGLVMDKMMKPVLKKGLLRLKAEAEKQKASHNNPKKTT